MNSNMAAHPDFSFGVFSPFSNHRSVSPSSPPTEPLRKVTLLSEPVKLSMSPSAQNFSDESSMLSATPVRSLLISNEGTRSVMLTISPIFVVDGKGPINAKERRRTSLKAPGVLPRHSVNQVSSYSV